MRSSLIVAPLLAMSLACAQAAPVEFEKEDGVEADVTATTTQALPSAATFAPYVDMTLWPTPSPIGIKAETGVNAMTLAFVRAHSGCVPAWGGSKDVSTGFLRAEISAFQAAGGDVVISFGGAGGTSLTDACTTAGALEAALSLVVSTYGVTSFDFDVEGAALASTAGVQRLAQAVASLQVGLAASGRTLTVSLTLPVVPAGLPSSPFAAVRAFKSAGAAIAVVNVMAMDYGAGAAPSPTDRMGAYAINSATATKKQLAGIYPEASPAELWSKIGITPMIGMNDTKGEVFTVTDAEQVTAFASDVGLGRVGMWSVSRDQPCAGGAKKVSPTCSGVASPAWSFTRAFLSK